MQLSEYVYTILFVVVSRLAIYRWASLPLTLSLSNSRIGCCRSLFVLLTCICLLSSINIGTRRADKARTADLMQTCRASGTFRTPLLFLGSWLRRFVWRGARRRGQRNCIIIIIIKDIYIAQVRNGHKCAMSAEMAVWLRNCLCLYSCLHN